MTRTLYLFAGAAPPVFDIARVIEDAQARGWDVCLGLTPTAARWLEPSLDGLAVLTGRPVRFEYPLPGLPEVWPPADVILVAPATFNTINGWALGLTETFVVGVLAEGIGKGVPMVAMPSVNAALMQHPQFERSVETLRAAGITVLSGGAASGPDYPWHPALAAAEAVAG
ncbi:flavoprotein [Streptomyces sp. NPDC001070]